MLEHGSNNSLPAKYRIALTLSVAFLIHTLLLSGMPDIVQDVPATHRQQLNLELIGTKSSASSPQLAENIPQTRPVQPAEPVLSTTQSQRKTGSSSPTPVPVAEQKADQNTPVTPAQPASAPSNPGSRTQTLEKEVSEEFTRITQSPTEQDPYLIKLAMHLASHLETIRIPAMKQLTGKSAMELELQLLENGALTRARVISSTGIEQIDSAAYRAALSASPYPEPQDQGGKNRFEVKLVFAPSRL